MTHRIKLLLLMALFAAPALAAWLAHHVWRPAGGESYGELLEPRQPDLPGLTDAAGHPASLAELRGRWVLLVAADGGCAEDCSRLVQLTRQVWLAQGRDRHRVARAVLVSGAAPAPTDAGLHGYSLAAGALYGLQGDGRPGVYVLDPLGRVMLRFPAHPDGKAMIGDLRRLLKASHIG